MLEAQLLLRLGASPAEDSVTVAELLQAQLEHGNYSPSSLADIKGVIDRLPQRFTSRSVRDVTPFVLDGLYQQLTRDGWSPFRIRRVHDISGASYRKRAIPFRWAISNPARDVRPPALPNAEIKPSSVEEVQRLLAAASGALRVYLRLSANTGARRGEVLAIQWRDVDLDEGRIVIRRSVVHTPATGLVIRERPRPVVKVTARLESVRASLRR